MIAKILEQETKKRYGDILKSFLEQIVTKDEIDWFPEMNQDSKSDRLNKVIVIQDSSGRQTELKKIIPRGSSEAQAIEAINGQLRQYYIWLNQKTSQSDLRSITIVYGDSRKTLFDLIKGLEQSEKSKNIVPVTLVSPTPKQRELERPEIIRELEEKLQLALPNILTGMSASGNAKVELPCDNDYRKIENVHGAIDALVAAFQYSTGANLGLAAITAAGGTLKSGGLFNRLQSYLNRIYRSSTSLPVRGAAGLGDVVTSKIFGTVAGAAAGGGAFYATDGDWAATGASGMSVFAFFATRPGRGIGVQQTSQALLRGGLFTGAAVTLEYLAKGLSGRTPGDMRCAIKRVMIGSILGVGAATVSAPTYFSYNFLKNKDFRGSITDALKSGRWGKAIDKNLKNIDWKAVHQSIDIDGIIRPTIAWINNRFSRRPFSALSSEQKTDLVNWFGKVIDDAKINGINRNADRMFNPSPELVGKLDEMGLPEEVVKQAGLMVEKLNETTAKYFDDLADLVSSELVPIVNTLKREAESVRKLAKTANNTNIGNFSKIFVERIGTMAAKASKPYVRALNKSVKKLQRNEKQLFNKLNDIMFKSHRFPDIEPAIGLGAGSRKAQRAAQRRPLENEISDRVGSVVLKYSQSHMAPSSIRSGEEIFEEIKEAMLDSFAAARTGSGMRPRLGSPRLPVPNATARDEIINELENNKDFIIKKINSLKDETEIIRSNKSNIDTTIITLQKSAENLVEEGHFMRKNADKLEKALTKKVYGSLDDAMEGKLTGYTWPRGVPRSDNFVIPRTAARAGAKSIEGVSKLTSKLLRIGFSRTLLEGGVWRQAAAGSGIFAYGYPLLSEIGRGDLSNFWGGEGKSLITKKFIARIYYSLLMEEIILNSNQISENIDDNAVLEGGNIFNLFPDFHENTYITSSQFYSYFKRTMKEDPRYDEKDLNLAEFLFAEGKDFQKILQNYIRPVVLEMIISDDQAFLLTKKELLKRRKDPNIINETLQRDATKAKRKNDTSKKTSEIVDGSVVNIIDKHASLEKEVYKKMKFSLPEQKENRDGDHLGNNSEDVVDMDFDPDDPEFMAIGAPDRLHLKKVGDAAYKKALFDETGKNLKGEERVKYALKKAEDAQNAYAAYNLDKPEIRGRYRIGAPGQLDLVIQNKKFTLDPKSSNENIKLIKQYVQNTKFKDLKDLPGPLKSKKFILKLIKAESAWNPRAVSPASAWGLGQHKARARQDLTDKVDPDFDAFNAMKSINGIPQYLGLVQNYITEKNKKNKYAKAMWDVASDDEKARIILYAYQQGVGGGWGEIANKIGASVVAGALLPDSRAMLDTYFQNRTKFYEKYRSKKNPKKDPDYANKIIGAPMKPEPKKIRPDADKAIVKKTKQGIQEMNKKDLEKIVMEVLTENSGKGYTPYPYGSSAREEEAPKDDYTEEWKSFSIDLTRDTSRETAITVAKILVQDLELFEDVLDLAGQNQSVGEEILRKLKEAREKQQNV